MNFHQLVKIKLVTTGSADSLIGDKTGHDNTVFTTIAKAARLDGEPEIYVLDQVKVDLNQDAVVKRHFMDATTAMVVLPIYALKPTTFLTWKVGA